MLNACENLLTPVSSFAIWQTDFAAVLKSVLTYEILLHPDPLATLPEPTCCAV